MALFIAAIVTIITLVSVGIFWSRAGWLPVDTSAHGPAMDHQIVLTLVITSSILGIA
jgi:hypothetical protein